MNTTKRRRPPPPMRTSISTIAGLWASLLVHCSACPFYLALPKTQVTTSYAHRCFSLSFSLPSLLSEKKYIKSFKKRFFKNFIFRERGREKEREGKKHQWIASRTPLTGDLACNLGMCLDRESNRWPFSLQAGAQSIEPHLPRPSLLLNIIVLGIRYS